MRRPDDEEQLTPEELAELGALLVAERPRPSQAFAAQLDARVAARFARPRPARVPRAAWLRWPRVPALAVTAAVALVALVVVLHDGGGSSSLRQGGSLATDRAPAPERQALGDAASAPDAQALRPEALSLQPGARKVEQSATLTLGAPADRVDDVAQDVLATVEHAGGIVDASSISRTGARDAAARFSLRIPADRLQGTLAELSQLPHAHVLSRSDDSVDVNQTFVSLRRRLADAKAEHAGLLRALAAATSEDETLRLKARLDAVERTIARTERAQRGLNRRIDYSGVELTIAADGDEGGGAFTPARALHDAGRVLAVAVGAIVLAAAVLAPLLALAGLGWLLARTLRRRRREQALDAG